MLRFLSSRVDQPLSHIHQERWMHRTTGQAHYIHCRNQAPNLFVVSSETIIGMEYQTARVLQWTSGKL